MKKILMLAAVAGLMLGSVAYAQPNSCLFFDVRDNSTANQIINTPTYPYTVGAANLGKAGDGQTLWLSPHYSDSYETSTWQYTGWPNMDGDNNPKTGCFWLYTDVYGVDGVISSIGVDFKVTNPATVKNTVASYTFAWDDARFTGTNMGKVPGAWNATTNTWEGPRAVHVPVSGTTPAFDTTGGLIGGATPVRYKLGKLSVAAGNRSCTYLSGTYPANHEGQSTYNINMVVNTLLVTRAYNGTPPDAVEDVAFGYASGVPETPYAAGNVATATSVAPDAIVRILMKGDFNGDGRILSNDTPLYVAAGAAGTAGATQRQIYAGDFNGDRRILSNDTPRYVNAGSRSTSGCGPF